MEITIQIRSETGVKEWVIVELQGSLEGMEGDFDGKRIGDLHFTKTGTPVLIVGHHILYGKVTETHKPLVVLNKVQSNEDKINKEYDVQAIIRKKLLFKSRPKPIIVKES